MPTSHNGSTVPRAAPEPAGPPPARTKRTGPMRLQWAVAHATGVPSTSRLVLHTLGAFVNYRTWRAHPSIDTIAAGSGLGASTVRRDLADLERRGLVAFVGGRSKGGPTATNRIWINIDAIERLAPEVTPNPPPHGGLERGSTLHQVAPTLHHVEGNPPPRGGNPPPRGGEQTREQIIEQIPPRTGGGGAVDAEALRLLEAHGVRHAEELAAVHSVAEVRAVVTLTSDLRGNPHRPGLMVCLLRKGAGARHASRPLRSVADLCPDGDLRRYD